MAGNTTVIVNNTERDLDMQVGNHLYFVHLASLAKGAQHKMQVHYNDTYQEFHLGVDKKGKELIVTSDDCCDYKCITITETDGEFDIKREPRMQNSRENSSHGADLGSAESKPKKQSRPNWRFWKS